VRLLVVEDDRDINRQVVTALEEAGYVADKAFDGEEGGYLGENEPYDAIILDMGLPKADGVTVLQNWRRAGVKSRSSSSPPATAGRTRSTASTRAPTTTSPSPSTWRN
jgi:DNA-binding response OmpR family regulator